MQGCWLAATQPTTDFGELFQYNNTIAAAAGLTIPKTSSRAITSPAGTADVMETLTPVDLGLDEIRAAAVRIRGQAADRARRGRCRGRHVPATPEDCA